MGVEHLEINEGAVRDLLERGEFGDRVMLGFMDAEAITIDQSLISRSNIAIGTRPTSSKAMEYFDEGLAQADLCLARAIEHYEKGQAEDQDFNPDSLGRRR